MNKEAFGRRRYLQRFIGLWEGHVMRVCLNFIEKISLLLDKASCGSDLLTFTSFPVQ